MLDLFYSEKVNVLIPQYKKFLEEEVYPGELQIITHPFRQSLPLLKLLRTKAKERKLWAPHLSITMADWAYRFPSLHM
jgi:acyl-CoA dehydrogenase